MSDGHADLASTLSEIKESLPKPQFKANAFSVECFLQNLAIGEEMRHPENHQVLERLCKKIEVPRRLYAFYELDLSKASGDDEVHGAYITYLCCLYLYSAAAFHDFKHLNTALKLLDGVLQQTQPSDFGRLAEYSRTILETECKRLKLLLRDSTVDAKVLNRETPAAPREINLVILAQEGAFSARSYLSYLRLAGFKPRKLIFLDFYGSIRRLRYLHRIVGRKAAGRLISIYKRIEAARRVSRENHGLSSSIQESLPIRVDYYGNFSYEQCVSKIERVAVRDLADPVLAKRLAQESGSAFCYACNGIVPASLLEAEGIRVIHTHPGVVPDVRGSDGLLWSIVARQKPGASCFYMNAGIDTGEIIKTCDFNVPKFALPKRLRGSNDLYNLLLPCYDRYLRADLFVDVTLAAVEAGTDLADLTTSKQDVSLGRTYYFMHRALRAKILDMMVEWE